MIALPEALQPLAAYNQFILWVIADRGGKQVKLPINYRTGQVCDAHDPSAWLSAADALRSGGNIGFVFTAADPFFFLDIDNCLEGGGWSQLALTVLQQYLPGAAVEISQSGRGLHVIGRGVCPPHACKNITLGLELYTEGRFVALTGTNAVGSAATDCSAYLPALVSTYFPPKITEAGTEWTTEPCAGWNGPADDDELIKKALAAQSGGGVFGGRSTFTALWTGDADVLAKSYPDGEGMRAYDGSSADAALAQHLAFWTGKNCERMLAIMWKSGLVRDKYEREDYLYRTILKAVSVQTTVYTAGAPADNSQAEALGAPKLRASSDAQRNYAEKVRAQKLAEAIEEQARLLCSARGPNASAKFWLDNQEKSPAELCAMLTPIAAAAKPMGDVVRIVAGHQYLSATLQIEHFKGCVYIQDLHKVFTPDGQLLKSEQFNATYGGYVFQVDETGDKTTRKAWEAFTESLVVRYPKAQSACFRPLVQSGALITEDSRILVNTYVPIETPRTPGDASPFLAHMAKILPDARDRDILLAYMAACVQHKGVKFQWAPLIQGAEGNGKTLLTRCVAAAIGQRYTHMPPANEISEKFNEWLFYKLFIGIEDVYVADNKREVIEILKPMLTNDRLAMRAMQQAQVMGDNVANFILNSNHKDAIRKTSNDRRFAVFYCAQQTAADMVRDGMKDTSYFPRLYRWLKEGGGYAIVTDYLSSYAIPDALNPATDCHRAPVTSSTTEAITASMGGVEQEIQEAIEEGRPGFAGGWVSSVAVEKLLLSLHLNRALSHNKRKELLESMGYAWHPALHQGRLNNSSMVDDGKKPRVFIKSGHLALNLKTPADVSRAYQEAQNAPATQVAQTIFNRG